MAHIQDQKALIRKQKTAVKSPPCSEDTFDQDDSDVELPLKQPRRLVTSSQRVLQPTKRHSGAVDRKQRSIEGMKGQLGRLIKAVSDSHQKSECQGKSVPSLHNIDRFYSCSKCDRMFCYLDEMQRHSVSCEKLA